MASHGGGAVLIPAAIVEGSCYRDGGEFFLLLRAPVRPAKPGLTSARSRTSRPHGAPLPKKSSSQERT